MTTRSNSLYLSLLICFLLFSCQNHPKYIIQGRMTDTTFDGEQMYLVPLFNATVDKVDSCTILQGKFRFEGRADSSQIFILRPKPILRLKVQEALVVKEAGQILVKMGQSSFIGGTAINDSLQAWKVHKEALDKEIYDLQISKKNQPDSLKEQVNHQIDSLKIVIKNFHSETAKRNKENAFGRMLLKMLGGISNAKSKS